MAKKTAKKETASKESKERKLDIFNEIFPAIDHRNMNLWSKLTDDQKKEFSPWLIQRWISGTDQTAELQEYFIQALNERVNINMNELSSKISGHPELLWMLLASCGLRKNYRRTFLPGPKSIKKDKIYQFLADLYPTLGNQELELIRSINDESDLYAIAESMNISRSDLNEIFK